MKRVVRRTVPLLLVQTACVGVGLWMQHHSLRSSLHRDLSAEVTHKLQQNAARLARAGDLAQPPSDERAAAEQAERLALAPSAAAILDGQGNVDRLLAANDEALGQALLSRKGAALPLQRGESDDPSQPGLVATIAARTCIAVVQPVPAQDRSILLVYPQVAIDAILDERMGSLWAISGVTLFWTAAVLTIAAIVVIGRIHDEAEKQRSRATSDVLRQAHSLVRTRDAVIFGLAKLADSRDEATGEHLERICTYANTIAAALRRDPRFANEISPAFLRLIGISAALHDIGKVGIEDRILLKPGPLNPDERHRIQDHSLIGGRCLEEIEQRLGGSNFLQMAREIALAHHERWDGRGYPRGLSGKQIPLAARIVAVADVYDALASQRVYKPALPHEECVRIIRSEAGKQLDPDIVEIWLTIAERFREIAAQYEAHGAGPPPLADLGIPPAPPRLFTPSESSKPVPELAALG